MAELNALLRRLLSLRQEEPQDVRQYIREAFFRKQAQLPQVDPNVFFHAPGDWTPPNEVMKVFEALNQGLQQEEVNES